MAKKPAVADNPTLPKVPIEISGRTYHLCYSFNALCVAESNTGLNLLQAADFQNLTGTKIRGLLYAALLDEQPDMTLEQAGDLLNQISNFGTVLNALVRAYTGSMPEPDPAKADEADSKNAQAAESS